MKTTMAMKQLFGRMETKFTAEQPLAFWTLLRQLFPQFNERGPRGGFKQQDAEDLYGRVVTQVLARHLNL